MRKLILSWKHKERLKLKDFLCSRTMFCTFFFSRIELKNTKAELIRYIWLFWLKLIYLSRSTGISPPTNIESPSLMCNFYQPKPLLFETIFSFQSFEEKPQKLEFQVFGESNYLADNKRCRWNYPPPSAHPPASSWIVIFLWNEIHHESLAKKPFSFRRERKKENGNHKKAFSLCQQHHGAFNLSDFNINFKEFLPSTWEFTESKELKLQGNSASTSNNKMS